MQPPRLPIDHPDRIDDLETAVRPALVAMMDATQAAGWDPWEIDTAFRFIVAAWTRRNAPIEVPRANIVAIEPEIAELLARIRPTLRD